MDEDISIWLIPKEPQFTQLQTIINTLAQTYGAYTFIPHITLYHCGNKLSKEGVITSIQKIIHKQKPLTLPVEKIDFSDVFTKTLFLQCKTTDELNSLYQQALYIFSDKVNYTLNPHLSLIYKTNMSVSDKKLEMNNFVKPIDLCFDRLMVIVKDDGMISKEEDITRWKVAFNKKFVEKFQPF